MNEVFKKIRNDVTTSKSEKLLLEIAETLECLRNDYLYRGGFFVFVTESNHRVKINKKDIQFIREIYHENCVFDIGNNPNQLPSRLIIFFSNASEPIEFSTNRNHENYVSESVMSELMTSLTYDNEVY